MTITLAGFEFSGPVKLEKWKPTQKSGVYVIMTEGSKPEHYTLLYVGESSNYSERGFPTGHHDYPCWVSKKKNNIYIGLYDMPNSIREERQVVEDKIKSRYNPPCNG